MTWKPIYTLISLLIGDQSPDQDVTAGIGVIRTHGFSNFEELIADLCPKLNGSPQYCVRA